MYSFESRVRYSETDRNGDLTLEAVIDYFQDCSTFHSESIHLGIDYLAEHQLIWVLSAWQIVINRMPHLCDPITVGTFPYDFKGCFGSRNFWLRNEKGEYLAVANSLWTLLDTQHMRPVRPNSDMTRGYRLEEKLPMEYAPRKIQTSGVGERLEEIVVRSQHIDSNNHVNNGQYVRIATQYLPREFKIAQLRAEYKKQAVLHDVMIVTAYEQNDSRIIALCDGDGEPYALMEFTGGISPKR